MRKKNETKINHPSFKTSGIVFYRKRINIYIWHVDILKGNCIRNEKKQDMNAMTWNLYKLSNLGM